MTSHIVRMWLLATALLLPAVAWAGPGHDHGETSAAVGAASPRFEASSDLFELVGIVDRDTVTLYLDRYQDNTPVTDATLDIEMLGAGEPVKVRASARPDGTFQFQSERLLQPGEYAFQIGVTAGAEVDILAANLKLAAPVADAHDHAHGFGLGSWLAIGLVGVVATVVLARSVRRRRSEVPA